MGRINREVREKRHFHSCPACGFIWDHEPLNDTNSTKAEFDAAHSCGHCGSQKNCDIACSSREEAEEFAVKDYITVKGKRYYAPAPDHEFLAQLLGMLP